MKYIYLLILLLLIPFALAEEEEEPECSWFNIKACVADSAINFFSNLLDSSIEPLSRYIVLLLITEPNYSILNDVWITVVEILSLTYGIIVVGVGLYIVLKADSPIDRAKAKDYLRDVIVMMLLVNMSFYLYQIISMIGVSLSQIMFNYVTVDFLTIGTGSIDEIGFQVAFGLFHIIILFITILLLLVRYALMVVGIVLFPLGIYFRFIPWFSSLGKFLVNLLMYNNLLSFVYSIIIVACYKISELETFASLKIVWLSGAFFMVDLTFVALVILAVVKSVTSSDVGQGVMKIGKFFL